MKNEKNKRILAVVCVMTLLCLSVLPASAAQESPYEFLLRCGYSKEVLNTLPEDILLKIYNEIGDNEVIDVKEEVYYLDEGGNLSAVNPMGTIDSSSLKITLQIGYVKESGTDKILSGSCLASWEWAESKPKIRLKDAISVNWDPGVFQLGSFYAADIGKDLSPEEYTTIKEYTSMATSNQGGIGHFTELSWSYKYVGGVIFMILPAASPMYVGYDYYTTVSLNYAHNRNPLGIGLSFGYAGVGISINAGLLTDMLAAAEDLRFNR